MKVSKSGKGNNLEQWKRENIEKKENGYGIKLNTSNTIFFPFIEQKKTSWTWGIEIAVSKVLKEIIWLSYLGTRKRK